MRAVRSAIAACSVVLCLVSPRASLAAEGGRRPKVAVLDVKPTGKVDPKSVEGLSAIIASEAARRRDLQVTSGADFRAMVGFEKQKELLGCGDASCLAEIGGALGVDYIVASEISTFGETWLLSLSLVDIRRSLAVRRLSRQAGSEQGVLEAVPGGMAELLEALPQLPGYVAAPPAGEPAGRSPWAWTAIGVGGAAAVVGGVLWGGALARGGDEVTHTEADSIRMNAGLGLGLLATGGVVAIGTLILFPGDAPASSTTR